MLIPGLVLNEVLLTYGVNQDAHLVWERLSIDLK